MNETNKKTTYYHVLGIVAISYLCFMLVGSFVLLQPIWESLAKGALSFGLYAPFAYLLVVSALLGMYFVYPIFLLLILVFVAVALYKNKTFRFPVYIFLIADIIMCITVGYYAGALISICYMIVLILAMRKWKWNEVYTEGMKI